MHWYLHCLPACEPLPCFIPLCASAQYTEPRRQPPHGHLSGVAELLCGSEVRRVYAAACRRTFCRVCLSHNARARARMPRSLSLAPHACMVMHKATWVCPFPAPHLVSASHGCVCWASLSVVATPPTAVRVIVRGLHIKKRLAGSCARFRTRHVFTGLVGCSARALPVRLLNVCGNQLSGEAPLSWASLWPAWPVGSIFR